MRKFTFVSGIIRLSLVLVQLSIFTLVALGNPEFYSVQAAPIQHTLEGLIGNQDPTVNNNWTGGNLCQGLGQDPCYAEGDNVPYRLEVTNLVIGQTYTFTVQYDYINEDGTVGYDDVNRDGLGVPGLTDINATNVILGAEVQVACGQDICVNQEITFTATGEDVTVFWNFHISYDASNWKGASMHASMVIGVDGEGPGNRDVPINGDDIVEVPALILTKVVDAGALTPDNWCFEVSPAINGETLFCIADGEDSVEFDEVEEVDYTIIETPDVSAPADIADYEFVSVAGVNCVEAGEMTATASPTLAGATTTCEFHNVYVEPQVDEDGFELTLAKTNNRIGQDLFAGDDVLFTLTVEAQIGADAYGTAIRNVKVTDLPADGFTYRPGSWTAVSSVRGDLKAQSITTEPTYSSPGDWIVGNMVDNEIVTLTYIADISVNAQPGLYRDLAWAEGDFDTDQQTEVRVLANAGTFFVGTEVNVIVLDEIAADALAEVTILPRTGLSMTLVVLASAMMLIGVLLLTADRALTFEKQIKGFAQALRALVAKFRPAVKFGMIALILAVTPVLFAKSASAAVDNSSGSSLLARVESPKTPHNADGFYLDFVVLDINNKTVSVKCLVQAPGSATFAQFGATKSLIAGGDNDICQVDPSVIAAGGTYNFKIEATNADATVVESNAVSVLVDNIAPQTPVTYEKTKLNTCTYRLDITTANDGGETQAVEIYRSTSTSFIANSSTFVAKVVVGSNQTKSYTDTVSNCSVENYYAVRAVDNAANASEFATDRLVIVQPAPVNTNTGGGTTGGNQGGVGTVVNPINAEGEGEVAGESDEDTEGEVAGENDEDTDADTDTETAADDADNESEEESEDSSGPTKAVLFGGLIVVAILAVGLGLSLYAKKARR